MRLYTLETVTAIFNDILTNYSWQGVALMGAMFILFVVQIYYYAILYNSINSFRLMQRRNKVYDNPPISVIVTVRGENETFLVDELPILLTQNYEAYEVVVVYIGGSTDYYDQLTDIQTNYSNLRITKIGGNERIYISTKQALNVGIKSAQYEALLFTTTGSTPRNDKWVATMAKGFERGLTVLGPAVPRFEKRNLKSYIMRLVEFNRNRNAMARAIDGRLYYAPRSNFGFTRRLYNSTRGYNYLSYDIGDNDLYMQLIATSKRTAVVLSPNAVVTEERPDSWHEWMEWMRYYDTTRRDYPIWAKRYMKRELGSRTLYFLTTIAAIVLLPLELKIAAAAMLLLRYAIAVWSTKRIATRMGEQGLGLNYWIYDIVGPCVEYVIASRKSRKTPKLWR